MAAHCSLPYRWLLRRSYSEQLDWGARVEGSRSSGKLIQSRNWEDQPQATAATAATTEEKQGLYRQQYRPWILSLAILHNCDYPTWSVRRYSTRVCVCSVRAALRHSLHPEGAAHSCSDQDNPSCPLYPHPPWPRGQSRSSAIDRADQLLAASVLRASELLIDTTSHQSTGANCESS